MKLRGVCRSVDRFGLGASVSANARAPGGLRQNRSVLASNLSNQGKRLLINEMHWHSDGKSRIRGFRSSDSYQ